MKMEHLYAKVSYLKGLAEGMEIEAGSKEGKMILHIIDALEEFADAISELNDDQSDLEEYVDYMDEDLADVEERIFGSDDEDYDEDYDDEDYDDFEYDNDDDDEDDEEEEDGNGLYSHDKNFDDEE